MAKCGSFDFARRLKQLGLKQNYFVGMTRIKRATSSIFLGACQSDYYTYHVRKICASFLTIRSPGFIRRGDSSDRCKNSCDDLRNESSRIK